MNDLRLVVAFSGGETSAYMAYMLVNSWRRYKNKEIYFVFANTGQESEETLIFIDKCSKEFNFDIIWLETKVYPGFRNPSSYTITDFKHASRKGEPFISVAKKYGIPNRSYPNCTRELKSVPMGIWCEDNFGIDYEIAIGIRSDESQRKSGQRNRYRLIYPLLEMEIFKEDVLMFWEEQSFRLGIENYQGNCQWCWKKGFTKQALIYYEDPSIFEFPAMLEKEYGLCRGKAAKEPKKDVPRKLFTNNNSTQSLIKNVLPRFVNSEEEYQEKRNEIITAYNEGMFEGGCSESCEAFSD